jgi:hypothetical protein
MHKNKNIVYLMNISKIIKMNNKDNISPSQALNYILYIVNDNKVIGMKFK